MSSKFPLKTYDVIIGLHNIHSITQAIVKDRETIFNSFYGSTNFNAGTPDEISFLQLSWDPDHTHLTLNEGREYTFTSEPINSILFHGSDLGIITHFVAGNGFRNFNR